ncbi:MAG: hypothetical protein ACFFC7_13435 [Candidatus Hermodarchaeota archaeon]
MQLLNQREGTVLVYCKICRQTHELSITVEQAYLDSLGGRLFKCTFIHEGATSEFPHAFLVDIDQNFAARRVEVTDLYIENSSEYPDDFFIIKIFCQVCQKEIEIPISLQRYKKEINSKGFYLQTCIHGQPPHSMVTLLDKYKNIRRAEITDLKSSTIEGNKKIHIETPKEIKKYHLLEFQKIQFSTIFDSILIFDQRSKTLTCFFAKERPDRLVIETLIDEINMVSDQLKFSFQKDEKEYFFAFSGGKQICVVGAELDKSLQPWLLLLSKVLLSEKRTPNSVSLEIVFEVMKNKKSIMEEKALRDLLFSPAYSLRMPWKYEEMMESLFEELYKAFPNATKLFYPCALGWISILETLNTEESIEHFEEFIDLITFVDRRGLI